jgi:hypothetical protein
MQNYTPSVTMRLEDGSNKRQCSVGITISTSILFGVYIQRNRVFKVTLMGYDMHASNSESMEGLSVDTAARNGICHIFPLNFQRVFH